MTITRSDRPSRVKTQWLLPQLDTLLREIVRIPEQSITRSKRQETDRDVDGHLPLVDPRVHGQVYRVPFAAVPRCPNPRDRRRQITWEVQEKRDRTASRERAFCRRARRLGRRQAGRSCDTRRRHHLSAAEKRDPYASSDVHFGTHAGWVARWAGIILATRDGGTRREPQNSETDEIPGLNVLQSGRRTGIWSSRRAKFITEPKIHATEVRRYMRDPDGHLIEVGRTTMTAGPRDSYV
jgi:hypothetical protein